MGRRKTIPLRTHDIVTEWRTLDVDHPVYPTTKTQVRFVCSCGVRTRWNMDPRRSRREIDRHALDGQLSAFG